MLYLVLPNLCKGSIRRGLRWLRPTMSAHHIRLVAEMESQGLQSQSRKHQPSGNNVGTAWPWPVCLGLSTFQFRFTGTYKPLLLEPRQAPRRTHHPVPETWQGHCGSRSRTAPWANPEPAEIIEVSHGPWFRVGVLRQRIVQRLPGLRAIGSEAWNSEANLPGSRLQTQFTAAGFRPAT